VQLRQSLICQSKHYPIPTHPILCHPCLEQLAHWEPGPAAARCVGTDSDIFLRTLRPGQGWECPRPPFEVTFHISARMPSTSGMREEGELYFQTVNGEPLTCSLGAGQLPPGEQCEVVA